LSELFVRVERNGISRGMFVAELDRPWLDTPFLIQGFLLESDDDLATLCRLCEYVYVDPRRSSVPISAPRPVVEAPVSLSRPAAEVRSRGAASLADVRPADASPMLVSALRGEVHTLPPRERAALRPHVIGLRRDVHPELAPPGRQLIEYGNDAPLEQELPRAAIAIRKTEVAIERLTQDIAERGQVSLTGMKNVTDDLVDSIISNPDALMWATRLRRDDTRAYAHGLRAGVFLLTLGRHIGFPREELRDLAMIGMLLDVGKIKVPRKLLEQRRKLTDQEIAVVRRHVEFGAEILANSKDLPPIVLEGIMQHHERMDGSGYPNGLVGPQISVQGRMAGLIDTFSAMITHRPYAAARAPADVLIGLLERSGGAFHPPLLEAFIQAIGVFPVGSLIELSSGHVGIVVRHNRVRRLQPKVLVLTNSRKELREHPMELDLLHQPVPKGGKPVRIVRSLPLGSHGIDVDAFFGRILKETAAA